MVHHQHGRSSSLCLSVFVGAWLSSMSLTMVQGQGTSTPPKPGDPINWDTAFPQWWFDIKNQYEPRVVRKCPFLTTIPNDMDSCPGVSEKDHYFCIFGTDVAPTWYCTCVEQIKGDGDYRFRCGTELQTMQDIVPDYVPPTMPPSTGTGAEGPSSGGGVAGGTSKGPPTSGMDEPMFNDGSSNNNHETQQQMQQSQKACTNTNGSFKSGFGAGVGVTLACMIIIYLVSYYCQKRRTKISGKDPDFEGSNASSNIDSHESNGYKFQDNPEWIEPGRLS